MFICIFLFIIIYFSLHTNTLQPVANELIETNIFDKPLSKNIAIVLSGELKNFRFMIDNQYKHLFNNYNVDIYVYISDVVHYRSVTTTVVWNQFNLSNAKEWLVEAYRNDLKNFYIDMDEQKFKYFYDNNVNESEKKSQQYNISSQLFKIVESLKLVDQNKHYDAIVRMRIDTFFMENMNIPLIDDQTIFHLPGNIEGYVSDGLIVGTLNNLLKCYTNLLDLYMKSEFTNVENDLLTTIKQMNLKSEKLDTCAYRVGAPTEFNLSTVPYINEKFKSDFRTDEYPNVIWS